MKLIKILSVIIVLLVIANVTITNRSVDEGVVVANLGKEINELQNQNTIMKATIAEAGSLSSLREKIVSAGYIETSKVTTLANVSSVASR
ncbi:hypothetical protein COT87_01890 [Candidatus Collierbacteria bacterium CG10_big_fil_rev_8_21_14_0_10_44_9]|uniref:Cell division protein FtsL n=1 Tax=Candidatus Collierbacteria bacterium CG10_big_fil_rev_8_21_14_0_10_44_9 TaxID=1974535 RepID=A0A2H0VIP7_9BACT|nr:MAG: hypothetical protein COT87_01890 [Candidatus Collierbacteria bacterium CG10_big_fil_rev_8_21_14_0_10_44_9]